MEITISIQELVLLILGIAAIVLLFSLIGLIKNLIETVKHANKVLEDTEIITSVAAEKAQELDGVIDDAVSSISAIGELIKGNQSAIKAATNVVNSLAGLKNLMMKKKPEKSE